MSTLFDSLPLSSSFSMSSLSLLSLSAVTSISTDLLIDSIGMFDHILRECHKLNDKDASLDFLKKLADELADIFSFISVEILGIIFHNYHKYLLQLLCSVFNNEQYAFVIIINNNRYLFISNIVITIIIINSENILKINLDDNADNDIHSKYDLIADSIKLLITSSSLLITSTRCDLTYDIVEAIKILPPSHLSVDLSQYLHHSLQQGTLSI